MAIHRLARHLPLIATLKTYKKEYWKKDLATALTVAVIAIPQSMAYAAIAGVAPVYGLYTAVISTLLSSVFASSEHIIGGPTNAISLLVASAMQSYIGMSNFYGMLFLLTFLVGVIQILFGTLRLGKMINYVSHAVIVGFTAGAGVLIALGQLNSLLGIPLSGYMPLVKKLFTVIRELGTTNPYALGLGLLTVVIIFLCRRIHKNLPGSLLGIILSVVLVMTFSLQDHAVKLAGEMPSVLPSFRMPDFGLAAAQKLLRGAFPIGIIGLVEAISISKSIASKSGQQIDADQEFLGQGITNAVSAFFQCFPGSGSFTRSAINYFSGAQTRISGMASSFFVMVILLFLAPFAKYIPNASLAGVIMAIGYNMVNRGEIRKVGRANKSDAIAMWVTIVATVLMPDLDWAIYMGIAISIVLYLKDTNTVPVKILIPTDSEPGRFREADIDSIGGNVDVLIVQLEGHLYFGSASDLEKKLNTIRGKAAVYILMMKTVSAIDVTALEALRSFVLQVKSAGGSIVAAGVRKGLNAMLIHTELADEIGAENIFLSEGEVVAASSQALKRAKDMIKTRARQNTEIKTE